MSWVYRFDETALKELKKQGHQAQKQIIKYLDERVAGDEDPRRFGKMLSSNLAGYWRFRVGDYRILCEISDGKLLVLVVGVGHRKNICRINDETKNHSYFINTTTIFS